MAFNNLEQDSHTPSDHTAPDITFPLLTLPDAALAQISQYSVAQLETWQGPQRGHPLLPVSRGCRDIALGSIHHITLDPFGFQGFCMSGGSPPAPWAQLDPSQIVLFDEPFEACDPAPWARLLHRACCQATPGLTVKLHLSEVSHRLPDLLQPGIDCGGWSKVHSLEV
jgi:hypothetical protein